MSIPEKAAVSLSLTEKKLIFHLSGDLGCSEAPYADLAAKVGLREEDVLAAIRRFQEQGLIRRFGATLRHQRSGFQANAMVVWRVEPGEVQARGEALAGKPYVSHCYQRRTAPGWPFNLYAMVHAESSARLAEFIKEMAEICGTPQWRILESLAEFKKTSRRYFQEGEEEGQETAPGE